MSQPCSIAECKRLSRAICHCCQQNICIPHLNEHNTLLNSQLNPLVDEMNVLEDRLKTFDIRQKTNDCREKLEQWRLDCHEKIEVIFAAKCEEINQYVQDKIEKQQQEILKVRTRLIELIRDQEATRHDIETLTSRLEYLQKAMDKIEQTSIYMNINPLLNDPNCISIKEKISNEFDLNFLSPAFHKIQRSNDSHRAFAGNDQYLLFHDAPNLCLLDRNLQIINRILWEHGKIFDMCWSELLNRFLIVELNDVYSVDENGTSIVRLQTGKRLKWASCTCSDTSLFLSARTHGSSIVEFSLLPTVQAIKEYKYPDSCERTEDITTIRYTNATIMLLIRHSINKTMRMELKSTETFDRIWSYELDIRCNQDKVIRCCTWINNQWLIADFEKQRLIHVTENGQMKMILKYEEVPWFLHLFGSNILAVSIRRFGLNFHRIENHS